MSSISKESHSQDTLCGPVERVTYHNEDNGYCVIKVKVKSHRDLVAVTGNAPSIAAGEYIEAHGHWIQDKKFGLQFKAIQLKTIAPQTIEGIKAYLGSGLIKGIGPHFASKLVKAFGTEVFNVIESEPKRLMELEGIGAKRTQQVIQAWQEQKVIRDIMVFLHSHGVGTARAVRIFKTYGEKAIELLSENPYRLANDIHGIGFKTADEIAMKLGIDRDSIFRAASGIHAVMKDITSTGHCAGKKEVVIEKALALLDITQDRVNEALDEELNAKRLISESVDDELLIFTPVLFYAENNIAKHIKRLQKGKCPWPEIDIEKAIPWVQNNTHIELSTSQKSAVQTAIENKFTVITGGPGVGKTTVMNSILKIFRAKNVRVSLCAPTGRAAKRLSQSTGLPASTVHRLLEFDPNTFGFKHDENNPIDTDLLVIDEASMLDVVLTNQLLRAIPSSAAVIIVGDVDQLPSVGAGAVLYDCIDSGILPVVRLTEIFRQAASSQIIVNAHRINAGQFPISSDQDTTDFYFIPAESPEEILSKLIALVNGRISKKFGVHPIQDIQVLTPMHRGIVGAGNLNSVLQQELNGQSGPRISRFGYTYAPGDKVIQNVNNYEKEVFNGDIGFVERVNEQDSQLIIQFDGRSIAYEYNELDEIALAYATSIHKSQGSEYKVVVIPIATQHFMMLARNLVYTAVTRGKQLVILIGMKKAVAMAINNRSSQMRLTRLKARLVQ